VVGNSSLSSLGQGSGERVYAQLGRRDMPLACRRESLKRISFAKVASVTHPGLTNDGGSSPSKAVRLFWLLLFFFAPMDAVAHVSTFGLKDGGEDALIRVADAIVANSSLNLE
jgi:hypothetical protein